MTVKSDSILDLMDLDGGWFTPERLALELDMSDEAAKRALHRMQNQGTVRSRVMESNGHHKNEYRPVDQPADPKEADVDKRCSSCKETKPLAEFGKNRSTKDGRSYYCKPCQRDRQRKTTKKPAPTQPKADNGVNVNGWRSTFADPSLSKLEQLRDLVGVSSLDQAAEIAREIANP